MGIRIIQPMKGDDINRSHKLLDRLDKISRKSVRHFAKNFLEAETVPDFCSIEIETQNRCNNDCAFCPVNRHNDTRKPAVMDEKIFYSIIDQLHDMDYHGVVCLQSNNEPLLDGRILKFAEYVHAKLPAAGKTLFTNGILLDTKKFLSLAKNLDRFVIDNYNDNFELIPSVKKVLADISSPDDFKCDILISLRKKNQKLNTRAGTAPNRINEENKFRPQSACNLPFTQMIVRPDGTTAKCCNDPLTNLTTGDLSVQTLREIWRGKVYQDLRKEMFFNGRQNIDGCEFCDLLGLQYALPTSAAPNEFKRLVDEIRLRKNLSAIYIFDTPRTEKLSSCSRRTALFLTVSSTSAEPKTKNIISSRRNRPLPNGRLC